MQLAHRERNMHAKAASASAAIFLLLTAGATQADCWRLPNGQIFTTQSGSSSPVAGATRVQCPTNPTNQQLLQRQQQLQLNQPSQSGVPKSCPTGTSLVDSNCVAVRGSSGLTPAQTNTAHTTPSVGGGSSSTQKKIVTSCGSRTYQVVLAQATEVVQATLFAQSFNSACQAHDACYAACNPRPSKNQCDQQFSRDMRAVCSNSRGTAVCTYVSDVFLGYVVTKGDTAYKNGAKRCGPSTTRAAGSSGGGLGGGGGRSF